jgi:tetratricopeptide (TPR) repeat protein
MPADRLARLRSAFADLHAGRFAAARATVSPLAQADPSDIEALLLLGLAQAGMGQAEPAAASLLRVAASRPGHAHPLRDLVGLLTGLGRAEDAQPCFRAALALNPHEPRLLAAFADYLLELGRPDDALALLRSMPRQQVSHNRLGVALAACGEVAAATEAFRAATAADAGNAIAWANLGKSLAAGGHTDAAIAAFDTARLLRPGDAQIGLNRAVALLRSGRLGEGWEAFEARLRLPGHSTLPRQLALPAKFDAAAVAGRTVLLTHEEGFGDTLQFIRYAILLDQAGADVVVLMPKELARLAATVPGVRRVATAPGDVPRFDWHCPMLSLPRAFATTIETIPAPIPYLRADADDVAEWAGRLAGLPGLRVGLVWAGASRATVPAAATTDRLRSLPLSMLAPLASCDGVSFVSLQKDAAPVGFPAPLYDPMPRVRDFGDTAAIIANLDLVISVDTAVAHLAGAMGKPVLLLDRFDNCWRWLSGREDSPWYPTLRIFRQPRPHAWEPVVQRIAEEVSKARALPWTRQRPEAFGNH